MPADGSAAGELQAVAQRLANMSPVFRAIGAAMVTASARRFDESRDPDGNAWAAQSETTLMMRARRARGYTQDRTIGPLGPEAYTAGGARRRTARGWTRRVSARVQNAMFNAKPLLDTGRLKRSITFTASATALRLGTNVAYAAAQQFGNPSNKLFGRKPASIPARRFLPLSSDGGRLAPDGLSDVVASIASEWIASGRIVGLEQLG